MRGNFAPGVNTYNNSIHLFCIQNQHIERDNLSTLHLGTKSAPQNIYIDNSSFLYRLSPANCNIKKSVPLTCIRTKKAFFPILLNSSFRFDLFYFQAMFLPFFYHVQSQFLISKPILYSGLFQSLTLVYFIFKLIIQNSVQIGLTLYSFCK